MVSKKILTFNSPFADSNSRLTNFVAYSPAMSSTSICELF